jgi:hypothetical protein
MLNETVYHLSKDDYTGGGVSVVSDNMKTSAEDVTLPTQMSPPLSNSKTKAPVIKVAAVYVQFASSYNSTGGHKEMLLR